MAYKHFTPSSYDCTEYWYTCYCQVILALVSHVHWHTLTLTSLSVALHCSTCLHIAAFVYFAPRNRVNSRRFSTATVTRVWLVNPLTSSAWSTGSTCWVYILYVFVVFCCFWIFPTSAFLVAPQGTPEPMARVVRSPSWTPGRRTLEIGNVLQETSFWDIYIFFFFRASNTGDAPGPRLWFLLWFCCGSCCCCCRRCCGGGGGCLLLFIGWSVGRSVGCLFVSWDVCLFLSFFRLFVWLFVCLVVWLWLFGCGCGCGCGGGCGCGCVCGCMWLLWLSLLLLSLLLWLLFCCSVVVVAVVAVVVGCLLFVVCCLLVVGCCLLFVALFVVFCLPFVVCRFLFVVGCLLLVVCCWLLVFCCCRCCCSWWC